MIINELTLAPNQFNHASAIASKGNLIAFYTGTAECHESQHVTIYDRLQDETIELEPYTGNPILYDVDDKTFIIYSKFEKTDLPRNLWWQHCSLWISEIRSIISGHPEGQRVNPTPLEIKTGHMVLTNLGYLPRCHPTKTIDGYYLPLYRESHPSYYGLVLHSVDGFNWTYRGSIEGPIPCIQPTLWEDHGKLCALLRNFSNKPKSMALYSESMDRGYSWSEPINSEFTNANNSILAIQPNYNEEPLIVWNNDPKGRSNLQIGYDMKRSVVIDNYGSYPAATVDGDQLHITYSGRISPIQIPDIKLGIKHKQLHLPSLIKRWRHSNEYKSR